MNEVHEVEVELADVTVQRDAFQQHLQYAILFLQQGAQQLEATTQLLQQQWRQENSNCAGLEEQKRQLTSDIKKKKSREALCRTLCCSCRICSSAKQYSASSVSRRGIRG